ncbi:unnamed protein product [Spirodela intermedia]|uniref:Protein DETOXIFICATION n=1 Tax=Spirodela intermedia TaxID=51605 RepID=A0ABN7EA12_SPIIN|nr:unnamed protein product [Spirodela intermedia]
MEAPLLQGGAGVADDWEGDCPPVKGWRDAWNVYVEESKKLWWIAAPIVFNILCLYGVNSVTQIFVGHLGNLELSAVAIGLSVISNFSFGFLVNPLPPLLSPLSLSLSLEGSWRSFPAWVETNLLLLYVVAGDGQRARDTVRAGVRRGAGEDAGHLLAAVVDHPHLSCFILCPIYVFATPILKLLGQQDDIAELAGRFALWIIPQMFANAINFPVQKFLQAQRKVTVLAWIGFIGLVAHVIMLWVWIISLAQVAYVVGWCKDAWTGLSSAAFKNLWAFVKLSLASAVMLCLEIWYLMVLVVLTGASRTQRLLMNINGWEIIFFIGVNAARPGLERVGLGPPEGTKHAVMAIIVTSLVIGLVCMGGILGLRDHFARAVANVAYLLAVTMVLNSVQPVISVFSFVVGLKSLLRRRRRGRGWQALVAYINLGCYYVFGLPLGVAFGYWFHWGGIWAGMLCGTTAQTLALLAVIWKTNWNAEAAQASTRVQKWGGAQNGNGKVEG